MRNRELIDRYGLKGDYLFTGHSIFDVLNNQQRRAENAPTGMNDDVLLNTPTDDLVDRLLAQFSIAVPVLDRAAAWVESSEGQVAVRDYWSRGVQAGHTMLGTHLRLSVPFSGDAECFSIQPSTFNSPPRAHVGQGVIVITYAAVDLNPQQAKSELESVVSSVEQYLGWLRNSVDPFNEKLKTVVRTAIEARKAKVLKDRNSIAALGFNLKPRPGAPKTYVAPVKRNPIAVQTKAVAPFQPEPVLDEETYKQILKIMEGMAHVMERSPSAFETMGEEALRQHFLVQLNGQFEGAATGETFNHKGKTDILIREKDRNIFIAECKFWSGEKAFLDTITQLLGYLSWRDTKAAVVIFSQNADFSKVVATIEGAIPKHPNHKRGPVKEGETRFRSVFGNPADANREATITVMAFNVPK